MIDAPHLKAHRRTGTAPQASPRCIRAGRPDLDDPARKERIAGLKVVHDQSRFDADRAQAMPESTGKRAITPEMVGRLSQAAREPMRVDGRGYRRDYLRALAQHVEVGDDEIRIMGAKSDLLRTPMAAQGAKSVAIGVPSGGPKWRCCQSNANRSPNDHFDHR